MAHHGHSDVKSVPSEVSLCFSAWESHMLQGFTRETHDLRSPALASAFMTEA